MQETLAGTVRLQGLTSSIFGLVCAPVEYAVSDDGRGRICSWMDRFPAHKCPGNTVRDGTFAVLDLIYVFILYMYTCTYTYLGRPKA